MPIINALFWLGIFLAQVDSITSDRTFQEKWIRFNNSDASMIFGLVTIPQIIIGTITPILVFIIKFFIGVVRKYSENKQN
jgi:glutaredoxin